MQPLCPHAHNSHPARHHARNPQVVRTALVDAASVSSLITTSEAVVVEAPEERKPAAGGVAPPDMY